MSENDDILRKADALLNKRHAGSFQPAPEQQAEQGYLSGYQADIPTLTEIVAEHDLESELERELIPTLTESIGIELDLDPDYTYHHHDAHALTEAEPQAPEIAEEFILDEAALEMPELEADAEVAPTAQQPEEVQPPPVEFVPEVAAPAQALQQEQALEQEQALLQEVETLLQEEVEPEGHVAAQPISALPAEPEAALPAEVVPEAPHESEAVPEAAAEAQPQLPEPDAVPRAAAPVSHAYRVERRMHISDSVAEQLLASLQQQVPKLLEQAIVPKLAAALDREISSLIDQFTIHIEYVVRDAITNELQKQLPELEARLAGKPPVDPV